MTPYLQTPRATLHHAPAEEVYPTLADGSVSMVWSDGPYALGKGEWDRMGVDGLAEWYAPHVEAWGRVCAPSASVYLWGTAEGWARLDPVMRAAGWTFKVLIVWDKVSTIAVINPDIRPVADVTEACALYIRGQPVMAKLAGQGNVWRLATSQYQEERYRADTSRRSGACSFSSAHPCQKPLAFADRAIRASTRPGDLVLDPFAGTNRCAVAVTRLPPDEARRVVSAEIDRRWLDAVRPALVCDPAAGVPKGQASLFGGNP